MVGHPVLGLGQGGPEIAARVFPPPYGVKRLALGSVLGEDVSEHEEPGTRLLYDCSTAVGDAGAPVVSLSSGRVWGMHIGGQYLKHNFAISMWSILSLPAVREIVPDSEGM